jgi:hypothetical protein
MSEYLFIGERRSETAMRKGYHWNDEVLCAKKLLQALRSAGIEPQEQEFANLWHDDGTLDPNTLEIISETDAHVVAMGKKVQKELGKHGVIFTGINHPAARGIMCRKDVYQTHIQEILKTEKT